MPLAIAVTIRPLTGRPMRHVVTDTHPIAKEDATKILHPLYCAMTRRL